MPAVEIKRDIYWVGAVDRDIRHFHGYTYSTPRGTTYNAYLIRDKKTALVDTVARPFADEFIGSLRQMIDPEKIDYVIVNHVEQDHSGALPRLMDLCPQAQLLGTQRCAEGLARNYYANWDFRTVKTGEELSLGTRRLRFIEAPMIHWPDSMFTYCPEEKLLLPNDAFGQHFAGAERFADQVDHAALMDEAAKYYANILWPLGGLISRKIGDLQKLGLEIGMIAPSHGLIWRTPVSIAEIVGAYTGWARQDTRAKAVIVYETMWQSTAHMARLIAEGLTAAGIAVKVFDINTADRTDVFKEMLDAKLFVFGSSVHDGSMLPAMAGFLHLLKGFKPKGRVGAAFGSYGWGGGAVKEIEDAMVSAGIEIAAGSLAVNYVPDEAQQQSCRELGRALARSLPESGRA